MLGARNNSPGQSGRDDNIGSSSSSLMNDDPPNPSKIPMISLSIGDWEMISSHQGDLAAIVYYGAEKLIWEVLEGMDLRRIEISWQDIAALQATTETNQNQSVLEVRLYRPPLFFLEMETPPGHHPNWQQTDDFTDLAEASRVRVHRAHVSPGVLEENYEQLLQYDPRLFRISQHASPIMSWPYFRAFPSPSFNTSPVEAALSQIPLPTWTASRVSQARSPTTPGVLDDEAMNFLITLKAQAESDNSTPESSSSSQNPAFDNMQRVEGVSSGPVDNSTSNTPQESNHNMQMETNKDSDSEVDEDFYLSFLNDTDEI